VTIVVACVAAFFTVVCAATGALVMVLRVLLPDSGRWPRSTSLWAGMIAAPLAAAAVATIALLLPAPLFAACHCGQHQIHHPHLCFAHPELASSLFVPALVIACSWLAVAVPRVTRLCREALRGRRWADALRALPAERSVETQVRLAACGSATAFTVGAFFPVIVFDRGLWHALAPRQRTAVLQHEAGHVLRRDGITLLVLRLCLALQPWLPKSLLDRWRHAAELACDDYAAERLGDRLDVAEALIHLERLRGGAAAEPDSAALALGIRDGASLEARVMALLDRTAGARDNRDNDIVGVALVTVALAALAVAWPGDTLHHAVETVAGLFHGRH
jgi:Zn-dependent protease with chaperone function